MGGNFVSSSNENFLHRASTFEKLLFLLAELKSCAVKKLISPALEHSMEFEAVNNGNGASRVDSIKSLIMFYVLLHNFSLGMAK